MLTCVQRGGERRERREVEDALAIVRVRPQPRNAIISARIEMIHWIMKHLRLFGKGKAGEWIRECEKYSFLELTKQGSYMRGKNEGPDMIQGGGRGVKGVKCEFDHVEGQIGGDKVCFTFGGM
eukprot:765072-Hanusia_phi.AAC.1